MVGRSGVRRRGLHPVGALVALVVGVATGLGAVVLPSTLAFAAARPTLSAAAIPGDAAPAAPPATPAPGVPAAAPPATIPAIPPTTATVPPTSAPPAATPPSTTVARPPAVPPTTAPSADERQAAAAPVEPAGPYAFLALDQGRPVRYDPCKPIHYSVNLTEAPANAAADLQEAVRRVSEATGMTFVYDGTTNEVPTSHRDLHGANRLPSGWPPVVVAWARPSETDLFTPGSIGEGGSTWSGFPGHEVYVTGLIVIDSSQNDKLAPGFGATSLGAVLMHELGHVVGLDHVTDQTQLMFANVTAKPAVYGTGDLAGLRLVGHDQGCLS